MENSRISQEIVESFEKRSNTATLCLRSHDKQRFLDIVVLSFFLNVIRKSKKFYDIRVHQEDLIKVNIINQEFLEIELF